MRDKYLEASAAEEEALEMLRESSDPMVRVIYSMSMRQLALTEMAVRIESEQIRQGGVLRRTVEFLEKRYQNGGSSPNLKLALLGDE